MKKKKMYQRLAGKLIFLTITRPDIPYVVSLVSQFMHAPKIDHLTIMYMILKYLKFQPNEFYTNHMDMQKQWPPQVLIGLDL